VKIPRWYGLPFLAFYRCGLFLAAMLCYGSTFLAAVVASVLVYIWFLMSFLMSFFMNSGNVKSYGNTCRNLRKHMPKFTGTHVELKFRFLFEFVFLACRFFGLLHSPSWSGQQLSDTHAKAPGVGRKEEDEMMMMRRMRRRRRMLAAAVPDDIYGNRYQATAACSSWPFGNWELYGRPSRSLPRQLWWSGPW
jgi:hypothetical protein